MREVLLSWLPFILLAILFYLLILRPQWLQNKHLKEISQTMTNGDEITTIGGIIGRLTQFDERTITLEVAEQTHITFEITAIKSIKKPDGTIKNV